MESKNQTSKDSFKTIYLNVAGSLYKSANIHCSDFDYTDRNRIVKGKASRRRLVKGLCKLSMSGQTILWKQPDVDKDVHLGMVGEKVFFTIERKGYLFYCSSTPQALSGLYDEWGRNLEVLKRKAQDALKKRGVVNHILN
jgi:hypothetical protein